MHDDPREAAARYRAERTGHEAEGAATARAADAASERVPTAADCAAYVETAIAQAIRRGDFDGLPGAGKPLESLGAAHDPDWWLRRKIEREQLRGLGPPALTLRVEDRELDGRLDALHREPEVREALEDFNRRVRTARMQLLGGPPVVTALRDVDADVARWHERRAARDAARQAAAHSSTRQQRRRRLLRGWRSGN